MRLFCLHLLILVTGCRAIHLLDPTTFHGVQGRVIRGETGEPLADALVTLSYSRPDAAVPIEYWQRTDADGCFHFREVFHASYDAQFVSVDQKLLGEGFVDAIEDLSLGDVLLFESVDLAGVIPDYDGESCYRVLSVTDYDCSGLGHPSIAVSETNELGEFSLQGLRGRVATVFVRRLYDQTVTQYEVSLREKPRGPVSLANGTEHSLEGIGDIDIDDSSSPFKESPPFKGLGLAVLYLFPEEFDVH